MMCSSTLSASQQCNKFKTAGSMKCYMPQRGSVCVRSQQRHNEERPVFQLDSRHNLTFEDVRYVHFPLRSYAALGNLRGIPVLSNNCTLSRSLAWQAHCNQQQPGTMHDTSVHGNVAAATYSRKHLIPTGRLLCSTCLASSPVSILLSGNTKTYGELRGLTLTCYLLLSLFCRDAYEVCSLIPDPAERVQCYSVFGIDAQRMSSYYEKVTQLEGQLGSDFQQGGEFLAVRLVCLASLLPLFVTYCVLLTHQCPVPPRVGMLWPCECFTVLAV